MRCRRSSSSRKNSSSNMHRVLRSSNNSNRSSSSSSCSNNFRCSNSSISNNSTSSSNSRCSSNCSNKPSNCNSSSSKLSNTRPTCRVKVPWFQPAALQTPRLLASLLQLFKRRGSRLSQQAVATHFHGTRPNSLVKMSATASKASEESTVHTRSQRSCWACSDMRTIVALGARFCGIRISVIYSMAAVAWI